jgi:hypothetical protein
VHAYFAWQHQIPESSQRQRLAESGSVEVVLVRLWVVVGHTHITLS